MIQWDSVNRRNQLCLKLSSSTFGNTNKVCPQICRHHFRDFKRFLEPFFFVCPPTAGVGQQPTWKMDQTPGKKKKNLFVDGMAAKVEKLGGRDERR